MEAWTDARKNARLAYHNATPAPRRFVLAFPVCSALAKLPYARPLDVRAC